MIEKELISLQSELQIDEVKVHFERSLTKSPPFTISFHLVTPGPDIEVGATDHTLRAATLKAFGEIREKLEHREQKRAQRRVKTHITSSPRRSPVANGGRG